MDVAERAEVIVQLEPFLRHVHDQCGKDAAGNAGLGLDVQDVEEHASVALQAVLKAGVRGVVEGAEQIVGQHRPEGCRLLP